MEILIAGGGPAGAAAAIAARMEGAAVRLVERSRAAHHKVCGEFISPGAAGILADLGAWGAFQQPGPYRIRRCILHLGHRRKHWTLAESAWGLSRLRLDTILLGQAAALGAEIVRGEVFQSRTSGPLVLAWGRPASAGPGDRLFGFKTHFEGPQDDAVELFFDRFGYAGVSSIEDGLTNVCGIAPESVLRRHDFEFDEVVGSSAPLAERLKPLRRRMRWLATGPLTFAGPATAAGGEYPAGDALGFTDPFTGTGILNALISGKLAGEAAARGTPVAEYLRRCRGLLGRPYQVASLLRRIAGRPETHWLAPLVPGPLLFRLTRCKMLA